MPLQRHTLKLKNVSLASAEVVVFYACRAEPTVEITKVTGMKSFAIILGHEYDIQAAVESSTRQECTAAGDCVNGVQYEYVLKSYVSETVGIGLNIGQVGTGVTGWTFPATEQTHDFKTACICCDDKDGEKSSTPRPEQGPNAVAMISAFTALAIANAFSIVYLNHQSQLGQVFLSAELVGLAASTTLAIVRVFARRDRTRTRTRELT